MESHTYRLGWNGKLHLEYKDKSGNWMKCATSVASKKEKIVIHDDIMLESRVPDKEWCAHCLHAYKNLIGEDVRRSILEETAEHMKHKTTIRVPRSASGYYRLAVNNSSLSLIIILRRNSYVARINYDLGPSSSDTPAMLTHGVRIPLEEPGFEVKRVAEWLDGIIDARLIVDRSWNKFKQIIDTPIAIKPCIEEEKQDGN